jgi:RNAse (barnase) inhibitor barstar
MSKLLERLQDASRSGVYRTARPELIEDVLRGSPVALSHIALRGVRGKDALLRQIASALAFPEWFGANWDALEDSLSDLSWRQAEGHVLLFTDFERTDELGILLDVLASSAAFWSSRGKPFFAVFADPGRELHVADLFREQ